MEYSKNVFFLLCIGGHSDSLARAVLWGCTNRAAVGAHRRALPAPQEQTSQDAHTSGRV